MIEDFSISDLPFWMQYFRIRNSSKQQSSSKAADRSTHADMTIIKDVPVALAFTTASSLVLRFWLLFGLNADFERPEDFKFWLINIVC